ncbi:TRAP transporter permease [Pseudomonas sp. HR96]|uniref:TRAP transporter permease n=1 Tax=Pseudomonas sp. HR96 TaxID=1027966 RepID=UPI002A758C4B|nr:TRAP transporter permease [Pseudomonas sp. HR96]WPP01590.1 TRAP transporter permease [Pseudomonas sp. HR96]
MSQAQITATESPPWTRTLFAVAIAFSLFQIVTAAFHPLSSQVLRAVHVGFLLLMVYLALPAPGQRPLARVASWMLAAAALVTAGYQWVYEGELIQRSGDLTEADMAVGLVLCVLVFEAARRLMGLALPSICALFLAYALLGQHLPGDLAHRGYDLDQLVNQLAFGTEGFYGTPTYVSATYIFLFILFGAFLEQAGMIKLFTDFAMGLFGHKVGGPAKVSVVSSALMGTITGSGVANVVTTGQFTIPLMKRFGYGAGFAGGVEATASMGSQLMPPVMGAVAFIMAETLNVPFVEVAKAALLPALLYFASVFWMVHLEARRAGLSGLPKAQCPDPWAAVRQRWYLLIPLGILVYLLFSGHTPLFAGTVGLALTAIVVLGSAVALRVSAFKLRCAFWVALGLLCTAFFQLGIAVVFAVIAGLIGLCAWHKGSHATLRLCLQALVEGARHVVPVGVACALVGVIIGVVSLTGVASSFAGFILAIGEQSLFLSLLLTMLTCLVLGMGIPTIPNYIITSSIAAPALLELGVPMLVSHMFVFYFGILADLTPPVALACFAAAPIAKERGLKISLWAVRIALAGFVVPFMAVYEPALMLQGGGVLAVLYVLLKAALAIGLWGAVFTGYLLQPLRRWERLLGLLVGVSLVVALPWSDALGFVLAALLIAQHFWRARGQARVPA